MSNNRVVPIFFKEQDDSWETPSQIVPRDEARHMKQIGLGVFENHGRSFRLFESAPIEIRNFRTPETTTRSSSESNSAISFSEMQANAGIVADHVRNPQGVIERAREKVKAYCSAGVADGQSPLPRGSWFNPTRIQILVEA